jgi:rhamnopyranosyl-N-acetylglucosaminyl-diphospho-decaprenol beta-1,3/1,4-galactofuranosyltransferase
LTGHVSAAQVAPLDERPAAAMRVLAYIHTFNDADVIDRTLDAVRHQSRPPDAVLIVDNASTDGTLDRRFPEQVSVVRNAVNLGTSGAIPIGFGHAMERGFDWMWILDADSAPEPEALATLLGLYAGWPSRRQEETGFVSCLPVDESEGQPLHGRIFTRCGRVVVAPAPEQLYYMCHVTIWSGCLYRLAAVRRIGLPNMDYVLDRGELEYAYRVMKAGYNGFIHQAAVLRHNIRGTPGLASKRSRFGPITLKVFELAPIRCYYTCRNTLYFTLYDMTDGCLTKFRELFRVRSRPGRGLMSGVAWQAALLTLNFALRPRTHGAQIRACLRGIRDGITRNISARF